jgi:hypothetical protein
MSLCCSLPYEATLAQAEELNRCGIKSREIVRKLLDDGSMQMLKSTEDMCDLLPLAVSLTKHSKERVDSNPEPASTARNLLVAAIQRSLYEQTLDESKDINLLTSSLQTALLIQQYTYAQPWIRNNLESSWGVRFELGEHDQNYLEVLSSLGVPAADALDARRRLRSGERSPELYRAARETVPAGEKLARRYIAWQAACVATAIFGKPQFRPYRVLTMDIAPAETIVAASLDDLPTSLRYSHLPGYAMANLFNSRQHYEGDARQPIPVPAGKLALITNIDGLPFHSEPATSEKAVAEFRQMNIDMLISHYGSLAPGGGIVTFPWGIASANSEQEQALDDAVVELARQAHHGVDRRVFHKSTLIDWMSEADFEIAADLSPIFQSGRDHFAALMVQKPREASGGHQAIIDELNKRLSKPAERRSLWPFNAQPGRTPAELVRFKQEAVDKIYRLYQALDYEAELVISPWAIANATPEQAQALNDIVVELARQAHHGVDRRLFHKNVLADPFAIQTSDDHFEVLSITKPRKSLVDMHDRAMGRAADSPAIQAQSLGLLDPTR